MFIINHAIQKVIEIGIIYTYTCFVKIGGINVNQIIRRCNVEYVLIYGATKIAIIKYSIIGLFYKFAEMRIKRCVPCFLITEAALYVL